MYKCITKKVKVYSDQDILIQQSLFLIERSILIAYFYHSDCLHWKLNCYDVIMFAIKHTRWVEKRIYRKNNSTTQNTEDFIIKMREPHLLIRSNFSLVPIHLCQICHLTKEWQNKKTSMPVVTWLSFALTTYLSIAFKTSDCSIRDFCYNALVSKSV